MQGSGLGPILFVLNGSDLIPIRLENSLDKYADDIYLLVPASMSTQIMEEIDSLVVWASNNNLNLNPSKCKEMIIRRPKLSANDLIIPPPLSGIPRVDMLKVLGVSFTDKLDFTPHFSGVLGQSSSNLFALRTLRAHGLEGSELAQVTRATVISKIMYASSSWWGFAGAEMRHRLQALIHRCKKLCFLPPDFPTLEELIIEQDTSFFNQILSDRHHVLHHLLPPEKVTGYDLRPRCHGRELPRADQRMRKTVIYRMLYLDI